MNAQIAPARDCRHPSATKSKPRNDTHRKILEVLGDQALTTNQITNAIGHESWIGVASALRAMHQRGEVVKIKSRDSKGIRASKGIREWGDSAKWRRKV